MTFDTLDHPLHDTSGEGVVEKQNYVPGWKIKPGGVIVYDEGTLYVSTRDLGQCRVIFNANYGSKTALLCDDQGAALPTAEIDKGERAAVFIEETDRSQKFRLVYRLVAGSVPAIEGREDQPPPGNCPGSIYAVSGVESVGHGSKIPPITCNTNTEETG